MTRDEAMLLVAPLSNKDVIFKNMFAAGCALHFLKFPWPGKRACTEALRAMGATTALEVEILENLPGHENDFAQGISATTEFLTPYQS